MNQKSEPKMWSFCCGRLCRPLAMASSPGATSGLRCGKDLMGLRRCAPFPGSTGRWPGGVAVFMLAFPAAVPMLLYYL